MFLSIIDNGKATDWVESSHVVPYHVALSCFWHFQTFLPSWIKFICQLAMLHITLFPLVTLLAWLHVFQPINGQLRIFKRRNSPSMLFLLKLWNNSFSQLFSLVVYCLVGQNQNASSKYVCWQIEGVMWYHQILKSKKLIKSRYKRSYPHQA